MDFLHRTTDIDQLDREAALRHDDPNQPILGYETLLFPFLILGSGSAMGLIICILEKTYSVLSRQQQEI